jgi:hypothetical protein
MRAASEAMRGATNDLRQQEPSQAAELAAKAAGELRNLERQLERRQANDRRGEPAKGPDDEEAQKLAGQRARAQELQEKIDQLTEQIEKAAGEKPGQSAGQAQELERLQQELARQLQEANDLLDQVKREDTTLAQGGGGFTFEGQGMVLSSPGTEAFKQDFAKWQQLSQQATQALERAADSLARRQLARDSRDRLASGVDDKPPASYESQVDAYFKALATKKKP